MGRCLVACSPVHRPMPYDSKHALLPRCARCLMQRVANTLTVHGLWPNYVDGYPACCSGPASTGSLNLPLEPVEYTTTFPQGHRLSAESMDVRRLDPAVRNGYASLCGLANHEWQKHGYCLGLWPDGGPLRSLTRMAADYFDLTFQVADLVGNATAAMDAWAASRHAPSVANIQEIYPQRVQVWCNAGDALNRLLAIRTCWDMTPGRWTVPVRPRACAAKQPYGNFAPCNRAKPVRLDKYTAPVDVRNAS
mmetsp:Transcript_28664/g.74274  ORF Transcript_28664/g.74274 Transcript_28664/m.74274 type:complete len:250 (+) Transcript_28664:111-860(+)